MMYSYTLFFLLLFLLLFFFWWRFLPLIQEHVCRKPQHSENDNVPHVQRLHMGL